MPNIYLAKTSIFGGGRKTHFGPQPFHWGTCPPPTPFSDATVLAFVIVINRPQISCSCLNTVSMLSLDLYIGTGRKSGNGKEAQSKYRHNCFLDKRDADPN